MSIFSLIQNECTKKVSISISVRLSLIKHQFLVSQRTTTDKIIPTNNEELSERDNTTHTDRIGLASQKAG